MHNMLIIAMYVQIYRSVLLSSRHHKSDQSAESSSPMSAAVKDERRTRRDKTPGKYTDIVHLRSLACVDHVMLKTINFVCLCLIIHLCYCFHYCAHCSTVSVSEKTEWGLENFCLLWML